MAKIIMDEGAKQLSYNYNYGLFSRAIFNDATVLLKNPDRVAQEGAG